ncbi:MAG TPA: type II secretion system protein [Blastocatellia bacterium]|nr:type II secretion system protein [Blastocatellia bacterium]
MGANERTNVNRRNTNQVQSGERGYALIALMAVMMFALILTTVAAPTLQRETQREKEEEMLWRGQQVIVAISRYRPFRGGAFPTDLKELVDGINDPTGRKIHLLRPSAICDPMTPCEVGTNWRTVNPGDSLTRELLEAIINYQEKSRLPINPQGIQELARIAQVGSVTLPGQAADTKLDGVVGQPENQESGSSFGGPVFGGSSEGAPIIGVASKKSGKMFRSYYGIEEYDHALFFPNVPVMAGGFISPFILPGLSAGAVPGAVQGGVPGGVPGAAPGNVNQRTPNAPVNK